MIYYLDFLISCNEEVSVDFADNQPQQLLTLDVKGLNFQIA